MSFGDPNLGGRDAWPLGPEAALADQPQRVPLLVAARTYSCPESAKKPSSPLLPLMLSPFASVCLYMYRMNDFMIKRFGSFARWTLMQFLSYHSITPRMISPESSTTTIGVRACICLM